MVFIHKINQPHFLAIWSNISLIEVEIMNTKICKIILVQ